MRAVTFIALTLLGAGTGGYLLNQGGGSALKGALIGACVVGIPTLLMMVMDVRLYNFKKDE